MGGDGEAKRHKHASAKVSTSAQLRGGKVTSAVKASFKNISGSRVAQWILAPLMYVGRGLGFLASKPAISLSFAAVALLFFVEWRSTSAVIDDFEISPNLSKDGLTPSMVSHVLDAKLKGIWAVAGTAMPMHALSLDKTPAYTIPGTGVSLTFLVAQIKRFFAQSQVRIGGTIVTLDGQLQTVVRIDMSGETRGAYIRAIDKRAVESCGSNKFKTDQTHVLQLLDAQISCAAEFVLKFTQPYVLAVYYKEIGDIEAAKDLANFALFNDPKSDDHWALNLLGSISRNESLASGLDKRRLDALRQEADGYHVRSNAVFGVLKKEKPDLKFALAHVNRGILLQDQRMFVEAKKEFDAAILEDPSYAPAYTNLASLLLWQSKNAGNAGEKESLVKQAMDNFQRARLSTNDAYQVAAVMTSWARPFFDAGQYDDAQSKLTQAIAADASFAPAHFLRGQILQRQGAGNLRAALQTFATAARLTPWNSAYAVQYAKSLSDNQKLEDSIVEFERASRLVPDDAVVRLELAKTSSLTIASKRERYQSTLDHYFQAHDMRAKAVPASQSGMESIEDQMLQLVKVYAAASIVPSGATTAVQAIEDSILQIGDRFLAKGHLAAADKFYREALQRKSFTVAEQPGSDVLSATIAQRYMEALKKTSLSKSRMELVDLAETYRPDDESLLIQKFLVLVDSDRFPDATRFASRKCGKKTFDDVVKKWLQPWRCPS